MNDKAVYDVLINDFELPVTYRSIQSFVKPEFFEDSPPNHDCSEALERRASDMMDALRSHSLHAMPLAKTS